MNPIPITWCLAGAGIASLASFGAGWQVHSWKTSAAQVSEVKNETKAINAQNDHAVSVAQNYEKDKADADLAKESGNAEIRTIYRDRIVRGDCGPDAAAVRVLQSSIEAANARVSSEPRRAMPEDPGSPDSVRSSGKSDLGE